MSEQIKYCNKVGTADGCTHAHDDVAGQEIGTINPNGFTRTVKCMFATPNDMLGGGGGGGGGGPPSPPRVPRVQVAPWAPARAPTYAQRAQSNPEMPDWMVMGKKLESEFPDIEDTYKAYKHAVETAIEAKKAADAAAQEAYKAAIAKAGGGKKKTHVPVGLGDKIGSFADEADSGEEV